MKLTIHAEGMDSLVQEISGLVSTAQMSRALDQAAIMVEGEAKLRCPVDTGLLQKSIQVRKVSELTREIVATRDYADYVEYGTVYMKAGSPDSPYVYMSTSGKFPSYRPFLRSALYSMEGRIDAFFTAVFNERKNPEAP